MKGWHAERKVHPTKLAKNDIKNCQHLEIVLIFPSVLSKNEFTRYVPRVELRIEEGGADAVEKYSDDDFGV